MEGPALVRLARAGVHVRALTASFLQSSKRGIKLTRKRHAHSQTYNRKQATSATQDLQRSADATAPPETPIIEIKAANCLSCEARSTTR